MSLSHPFSILVSYLIILFPFLMTKPSLCCLCKYFFFFSHLSFPFSFIRESFSLPWSYFVTVRFTEIDFRLKRRCMKRRRRRFCDVSILPAKQMSTSDAFSAFFVFPAVRSFSIQLRPSKVLFKFLSVVMTRANRNVGEKVLAIFIVGNISHGLQRTRLFFIFCLKLD